MSWASEILYSRWLAVVRLCPRDHLWDVLDETFGIGDANYRRDLQQTSKFYPHYARACDTLCIRIDGSDN